MSKSSVESFKKCAILPQINPAVSNQIEISLSLKCQCRQLLQKFGQKEPQYCTKRGVFSMQIIRFQLEWAIVDKCSKFFLQKLRLIRQSYFRLAMFS